MSMQNYEQVKLLGKGSYGSAFLVKNKRTDKLEVMKVIPLGQVPQAEREAAFQEAKILKMMENKYIVRCTEAFQQNDQIFIVMQYADSGDLQKFLEKRKETKSYLKEDEILTLFTQMCIGLRAVHAKHILHRDVKGANIFMHKDEGRLICILGDFGVGKIMQCTKDIAKTVIGTPYYMSPEIIANKPYNSTTDVWSLGCILYEMCTLDHVFDANSLRALQMKILGNQPDRIPSNYSDALWNLCKKMLEKDPKKRITLNEVLQMDFIVENARKNLPADIFKTEIQAVHQKQEVIEDKQQNIVQKTIQDQLIAQLKSGKASAIGRIESVRAYLESKIGFEPFFNTYKELYDAIESKKAEIPRSTIERLLGRNNMQYVQVIIQLVVTEMESVY